MVWRPWRPPSRRFDRRSPKAAADRPVGRHPRPPAPRRGGGRDQAINGARDLVHLPANESITLTARKGSIPITLASSAPYTARVRIRLSSQKLAFHGIGVVGGSCQPGASAETCVVDLHNQNTTLKVPVEARTAGVYPLKIELISPDGGLPLATAQYTVRSTAASGVGIVLSIGAALLLVLWWGRDLHHGRRARRLVPAAPPVERDPNPTRRRTTGPVALAAAPRPPPRPAAGRHRLVDPRWSPRSAGAGSSPSPSPSSVTRPAAALAGRSGRPARARGGPQRRPHPPRR